MLIILKKNILSGFLSQILGFQVLEVCLAHALITEREEVMGTLDQANGPGMAHWTEIPAGLFQHDQLANLMFHNDHDQGYVGVPKKPSENSCATVGLEPPRVHVFKWVCLFYGIYPLFPSTGFGMINSWNFAWVGVNKCTNHILVSRKTTKQPTLW